MFGLITEALARRRDQARTPFTIVSCDNLQGNGSLARKAFVAFARLRDPQLGAWVEQEVRFPNSMVDRITPATTDADREEVRVRFGIEDRWPVVCEPFVQWVLEDSFSSGRPQYEQVGVQVVNDVEPYELMTRPPKTRCSGNSYAATWTRRQRPLWSRFQVSTWTTIRTR
jgi:mannitol 2-dehydrogenase